ncbi:hypothetical protein [Phyllobacterium sp. P5_D12]
MADRPILFSAPMVQALIAGRKTQTRRMLKPQPELLPNGTWHVSNSGGGMVGVETADMPAVAPDYVRYEIGDRLWVREAWRSQAHFDGQSPAEICAEFETEYGAPSCPTFYEADKQCDGHSVELWQQSQPGRLRASMHMPRCASRLTLPVTDVRVERLQDISSSDAIAEGIVEDDGSEPDIFYLPGSYTISGVNAPKGRLPIGQHNDPRPVYRDLINNLHGGDLWSTNPWVVAVSFDVIKQNIDEVK